MRKEISYLMIGCINTIFGYSISLLLYEFLKDCAYLLIILIASNIISISFSFLMYKKFVFKSSGNWLSEYLRCYVVYGLMAIFNIVFVFIAVKWLQMQYWVAQAISIVLTIIISYVSHAKYTFKR